MTPSIAGRPARFLRRCAARLLLTAGVASATPAIGDQPASASEGAGSGVGASIALGAASAAMAVARPALAHLHHTAWTDREGVPGQVMALAQTSDGYLWLGTPNGLFRFDGVRFDRFDAIAGESLPAGAVLTLMATPDNGLWVGYVAGGTSLVRDGHLLHVDPARGAFEVSTRRFGRRRDGSVWVATGLALLRYQNGVWTEMGPLQGYPARGSVGSMDLVVDHDDKLWVACTDGVYLLAAGQERFRKLPIDHLDFAALALAPDGHVWASDPIKERGVVRLAAPAREPAAPALWRAAPQSLFAPAFDDRGDLWYGASEGLVRQSLVAGGAREVLPASALSGDFVMAVLQDREGTIWLGTNGGLDRLRPAKVTPVDFARKPSVIALATGRRGEVWLGARAQGLMQATPALRSVPLAAGGFITALMVDSRDALWIGAGDGVWQQQGGGFVHLLPPAVSRWTGSVQALAEDRTGAVWIAANNRSLSRYAQGRWEFLSGHNGFPRPPPACITVDGRGRVWIGYEGGRLLRVDGQALTLFGAAEGLRVGGVKAIEVRGEHVWIGGELGVQLATEGGLRTLLAQDPQALAGVTGIVETAAGDLWLNGAAGIVHVAAQQLRRALDDAAYRVASERFDTLDGLPGKAEQSRPLRTAQQSADGRLWFALSNGVVTIDPATIPHNTRAPWVGVQSVSAGGRAYRDAGLGAIALPAGTRDLRVDYTATSLAVPERVRFRYKLSGLDADWQEAGTRRQAFYTNLGPGHYEFLVLAANDDGVWSPAPAAQAFDIAPSATQTPWFHALCALAALLALWLLYVLRARQLGARIADRMRIRMLERERIARDLHDTLLQGFQGLMLRLQAVAEDIPAGSPTREQFERVLDRADAILLEGRERVTDLRLPSPDLGGLAQTLAGVGRDLSQHHAARFVLTVEGEPRALRPLLHEDVCLLAREALFNAFQHAHATRIELAIVHSPALFTLRVRDDGCGLPAAVAADGARPGHWGLAGMRERAARAGGRLRLWSRGGAGTEIELEIPGRRAYADGAAPARPGRLAHWWRRRA